MKKSDLSIGKREKVVPPVRVEDGVFGEDHVGKGMLR